MNDLAVIDTDSATEVATIPAPSLPGIYADIPNETYHAGPGISKSGLWTIHTQTPAHYKFAEREQKDHFDVGDAQHSAVFEPETFEDRVIRGPVDRRGKKWEDATAEANNVKKVLLTAGDYDATLAIRDAIHSDSYINRIITGGKPAIEHSAYWIDPATGLLCRCRPDVWREDIGLMVDGKSTQNAHPDAFARSVINYGYHAQEAIYTDGWNTVSPVPVQGFVFLTWEKKAPFAFALYELPPSIVQEGRAIISQSMSTYADCVKADHWPAYGEGVQELSFERWSYKLTPPPQVEPA